MNIYRKGSFWFTLMVLVIVLAGIVTSFSYKAEARIVPLAVCIPTALLCILVLLSERYPKLISNFDVSLTDFAQGDSEVESRFKKTGKQSGERPSTKKVLISYGWICVFFILIFLVGYIIAIPVAAFLYLKFYWRKGWLKTLVVSLVLGGLVYGGFEILMKADMFEGILFGGITPPL
ncbi:tripartite tricarboxylate transporter TctB family protein [Chloroflexota bacterium]